MARLVVLILLFAPVLHAATYLVPPDAELIQKSDSIVVATGVRVLASRDGHGRIVTRSSLRIDEVLKGDATPGEELVLTEPGGVIDGRWRMVSGAPRYEPGVRYLVFTSTNRDFEPATLGMALGQFTLEGGLALRRGVEGFDRNFDPHVEGVRDASRFARYIRDVVAQRAFVTDYFVSPTAATSAVETTAGLFTRSSYLLEEGGVPYRWNGPSADWVRNGTQPGSNDGGLAVANSIAEWNATDSDIDYRDTGVDAAALGGLDAEDGKNTVLFNDPNNEIGDGSGVVGIGGAFGGGSYSLDGETFVEIVEGDVVVANIPFSQSCLDTIVVHEQGHSLGIRHSNLAPGGTTCGTTAECTTDAIMNSSIQCVWNGKLKAWDQNAAATVYGEGPECVDVAITQQPRSITAQRGLPFALAVTASGTEPVFYEWFEGERGVTTHPVGTRSRNLNVNDGRTAPTQFWVRVSNNCSSVDSEVANVTIPVTLRRRAARH